MGSHIPLILKTSGLLFAPPKYQLEGNKLKCSQGLKGSGRGQTESWDVCFPSQISQISEVSESIPPNLLSLLYRSGEWASESLLPDNCHHFGSDKILQKFFKKQVGKGKCAFSHLTDPKTFDTLVSSLPFKADFLPTPAAAPTPLITERALSERKWKQVTLKIKGVACRVFFFY